MSSTNANLGRKYTALKIILALLPTLVFTQAYGWMTLNRGLGYAFIILWALSVMSVWQMSQKNRIIARLIRLLEIGLFFLPVATVIMTIVMGATAADADASGAAKAGMAAGLAIGGFFITVFAFMIGIVGGIIAHIVGNGYAKKAEKEPAEHETFLNQHGLVIFLAGLLLTTLIVPVITPATDQTPPETTTVPEEALNTQVAPAPVEPLPVKFSEVMIKKELFAPEMSVNVTNISDKKIAALKLGVKLYTKFDEPVKNSYKFTEDVYEFYGLYQENILPGETAEVKGSLTGFDNAAKGTPELYQVKFEDGSEWLAPGFTP